MRSVTTISSALLLGGVVVLGAAAAWAGEESASPGLVTPGSKPSGVARSRSTEPSRGVGTYGRGATRLEAAPADRGAPPGVEAGADRAPDAGLLRKISGLPMVGSVRAFALTPDGTIAVYIADQEIVGRTELYRAPVDGSAAPLKLSAGIVFGTGDQGVRSFQISPTGQRVVFLADANAGGGTDDLYSVPIDGSAAPIQLNTAASAPVIGFGISPNGGTVAFLGEDTAFGGTRTELYAASVGVAASGKQLSDARASNPNGDVVFADFSPDGTRAIYAADAVADGVFQWFSVSLAATAPGTDVQLSAALGSVTLGRVSPSGSRLVYAADEALLGVLELYSIPITGGTKVRLNGTMAGDGVIALAISPDGARVGYLADQTTPGVAEVYSAQIAVASSGVRLNTPMSGTQFADVLNIAPDSTTVLYEADQTPGTVELFRVPIDASAAPTVVQPLAPPFDAGYFNGLGTPVVGKRAVYPVVGTVVDVWGARVDGATPAVRLNDPLGSGDSLMSAFIPPQATRLMAYGVGPATGTSTKRAYAVAVRRDLVPEQFNTTASAAAQGVLGYEIASTQRYAVYLQDQDTAGKPELYSRELDSDADGAVNGADNCPFLGNPGQGAVVFGQTVLATGKTRFAWTSATDLRFARGPLVQVATLATDSTGTLADALSFSDAATPAAGAGYFYLFAPDCAGRSYQTTLGSEPSRDLAALP